MPRANNPRLQRGTNDPEDRVPRAAQFFFLNGSFWLEPDQRGCLPLRPLLPHLLPYAGGVGCQFLARGQAQEGPTEQRVRRAREAQKNGAA